MKIYVADDEKLALDFIERAIKKAAPDAEISCFLKSRELLERMEDDPCDVAFLDVEMPGISGIELAEKLKEYNERVNIIFATGYSEYMPDALRLFASGYVLKPVSEAKIKEQLANLRYKVSEKKEICAYCFGNFTIAKADTAIAFRLNKSRELLAYLIDRKGNVVSRKDAFAALFEDEPYDRNAQKNFSKIIKGLEEDLEKADCEGLFIKDESGFRVDTGIFYCDMYEYLKGNKALFHGEYMEQYSWGEEFKAREMEF